jgi:diguanylate cyclase (GGDEF)-like protein/PAS domain S-box-containing protein
VINGKQSPEQEVLRQAAERRLEHLHSPSRWESWDADALTDELQIHHVELELQNEELQLTASELEIEREAYHRLYEHAPAAYFSLDGHGDILHVNQAGLRLLNFPRDQLLTRRFVQFIVPEQRAAFSEVLRTLPEIVPETPQQFSVTPRHGERLEVHLQGLTLSSSRQNPSRFLLTLMDITPLARAQAHLQQLNATLEDRVKEGTRQLLELNAQLRHQAMHDFLTGLPNRAAFAEYLQQALDQLCQIQRPFAVLFFDVDRFKAINDGLGHLGGDQILVELSQRTKSVTRPADHIARLGGDEFAMLLGNMADVEAVSLVVSRLEAAVQVPFLLEQQELFLSISTGVLLVTDGDQGAEELMRDVDLALYQAKRDGRARAKVFESSMREEFVGRLELEAQLRHALEREELIVQYQPIVALEGGHVLGFEALVRWEHPQRGLLLPETFLPLAEELKLVGQIDRWVLQEAERQLAAWQIDARPPLTLWMNVNASAESLHQILRIAEHLVDRPVPDPWRVQVEITERLLTHREDDDPLTLEVLRRAGVVLVIDDFGTGYSSLSSLHRFPVGMLKIDRSLVAAPVDNSGLIRAIVVMGDALGMTVVAEGLETEEQQRRLLELGVRVGQGWLFAPPLQAAQVEAYFRAHS